MGWANRGKETLFKILGYMHEDDGVDTLKPSYLGFALAVLVSSEDWTGSSTRPSFSEVKEPQPSKSLRVNKREVERQSFEKEEAE
jgi:hypothetical protein